jgi:hypothetical protein
MSLFKTITTWIEADDKKTPTARLITSGIRLTEFSFCLVFMIIGVTVVAERLFESIF